MAAAGQGGDGEEGRLRALLVSLVALRVLHRAHDVARAPLRAARGLVAPPLISILGCKTRALSHCSRSSQDSTLSQSVSRAQQRRRRRQRCGAVGSGHCFPLRLHSALCGRPTVRKLSRSADRPSVRPSVRSLAPPRPRPPPSLHARRRRVTCCWAKNAGGSTKSHVQLGQRSQLGTSRRRQRSEQKGRWEGGRGPRSGREGRGGEGRGGDGTGRDGTGRRG